MKIVVLDGYTENPGDLSWNELEKLGSVTVYDRTAYAESPLIAERIGDAEIVVMNKTPISRETIDACPGMKFISLLATGYSVVDYAYARTKGIPVANVPTYGTASVSQFSIALLLEICHHIGHHSESVHAGNWADNADWCYWDYPLIELEGKTIGIIGFGRIGKLLAHRLRGLGAEVTVSARRLDDLAWIDAFGYRGLRTNRLAGRLGSFRVVFNTVPNMVLTEELLRDLPRECVLLELASQPGFDRAAAEARGLKCIAAPGLPGRAAPETAARAIKLTLEKIWEEEA